MQDLGVCEDIIFHDDFNIPDVDKRICNFEELFGGDLDPIGAFLDENDWPCSSVEKDMPLEKSNNRDGRARKGSILNYEHWKSLMLKHTSLMLKHHARENAMMRYKEKKRARM
ncbi:hypothetical protein BDE02_10G105000 [Populus trichocarpa]|nr:hypothetical protein BDE02_10G105000 [Populus trichocarpa]